MADSSGLQAKIKSQVEFYFGDSNFRRDKFLRAKADADPQGCECCSRGGGGS